MKFKKGLLNTLTIGLAFMGIVSMSSNSHAAVSTNGKLLKIQIK